jgi:hypothetical protein
LIHKRAEELNKSLKLTSQGFTQQFNKPKNGFLNPNEQGSEFPQYKVPENVDFRSVANPFSGTEQRNMLRSSKPKNILKVKVYG